MNMQELTPQQQWLNNEMSKDRDKVTISWSKELKEWHPIALRSLQFVSVAALRVPMKMYRRLFESDDHGVNMNVVGILCNNIENVTPDQVGYVAEMWADVLELNATIAATWNAHNADILKAVEKRMELLNRTPAAAGMMLVKGEA